MDVLHANNLQEWSNNRPGDLNVASNFELRFNDIHIWHILAGHDQSIRFDFQHDSSYIQMVFSLDGLANSKIVNNHEEYEIEQNSLLFVPAGIKKKSGLRVNYRRELFGINISVDALLKFLPLDNPIANIIKSKVSDNPSDLINLQSHTVTIAMCEVIHQIMQCAQKDYCRYVYYQAKILELLSLQLEQFENGDKHVPELKKEELRRIYQVREILEQHPEESFSLLGLAHTVGTNDSTLKKHFKLVYGTTVFGYLNSFRMKKAKEMLLEQDCKIASIANQFGYKHATHFTAAFKKHFGYPPTKVKAV